MKQNGARKAMRCARGGLAACALFAVSGSVASAQLVDQPPPPVNVDSVRAAEADRIITRCSIRDASDPPDVRLNCWEAAAQSAPTDMRVLEGKVKAQAAVRDAEKAALSQAQSKSTRDSIEFLLARSREELARGSMDGADRYALDVLAKDANNQRALDLRDKISTARALQANKRLFFSALAAIVVFITFITGLVRWIQSKRPKKEEGSRSSAAAASTSRVALRVIDGVGRGRMYNITADSYRIGAAESDRVEEKNDLILSDEGALVSRFHCSLLKQKKRWTIVDSSVNGTWVNEKRLERGEPMALRDGDEIIVAGISRLTFVVL